MLVCATCGRENPGAVRFCGECGAELAAESAQEVRKTVTVLFADVTGSTALGERLDPESFRRVMGRYYDAAKTCVERHGGTVEKFIGDAVMAVFGVPRMHEDDALRALRAAVDLDDSLAALNDQLELDYGISLKVRTGVNSGEAVTSTDGLLATGDTVNVAARLEQAAQPDEILIGEQTRRLARAAIEVEPVQALSVKGKVDPLHAHRLLRVVAGAPAFERRFDAPLVGRQAELAQIRSVFDEAVAERRCRRVTALGPPGIGKSRLAREVGATLANEATVLSGRCLPYGEGITYWPLVEIFREAGAEHELEAVLSAGAPEEIFWSARKALERHARERPMALIVEDIHWAEPTLLDLIEHLADWTRAPLLLLCLARPELIDERPAWSGQSITLEPLSDDDSEQLIAALLGDSDVESDARSRIREVAGGNPLFVEQLLAMLVEGGDREQVPATMYALLGARLDALPDDERDLLERASVVGLDFEWEAVGELSRRRQRPPGTQLAALVRKGFIRPHEGIEDTFRFRHMLIRDAAYERVPKELRSELHDRFASWLDGRGEELDEIVGYHLEQAYRCLADLAPQSERAHALAQRASLRLANSGRRAFDRGDTGAALNLLERGASLAASTDQLQLRILPSLGRVLRERGQLERADATLSEAIELGGALGDQLAVADATVAVSELRLHMMKLPQEEVLDAVGRAMRVFSELGDKAGMARALTLRGKLTFWRGEAANAFEDLDRAAQLADEAGERAEEAESLQYVLATMHRGPMPVDEALARIEELRPRAQINRKLEVTLLETRAHLEAMQMRFDIARDLIADAKALAEEFGLRSLLDARTRPSAGYVELLAGDAAAAESELRVACEGTERMGELGYLSSIVPMLVDALLMQERVDEALSLTERWRPERLTVPEDADAHAGWRRVRAKVLARKRDVSEAEHLGRSAVAIASATDYLDAHAMAVADLGEVLRLSGQPAESAAVLEEAIELHEEKGNVAAAARLRGMLAELSRSAGVEL